MGGGDAGLKAIAKRQKQNGLGRLRLYCQMCEKQCRDENGFRNHTSTEAHQRNLALFASTPAAFVTKFSAKFLAGFLAVLRQRYGSNAVASNTVYQEYIKDKEHVHMNSTQWTTLTEFTKDLGRRGVCKVEERDGGLWVVFVDRDAIERGVRAREMEKARLDEEERADMSLERKMRMMGDGGVDVPVFEESDDEDPTAVAPIDMDLKAFAGKAERAKSLKEGGDVFKEITSTKRRGGDGPGEEDTRRQRKDGMRRSSVLDEIIADEQKRGLAPVTSRQHSVQKPVEGAKGGNGDLGNRWLGKDRGAGAGHKPPAKSASDLASNIDKPSLGEEEDAPPWIVPGIVVKCVAPELKGGPYYKKKGVIKSVKDDGFTAVVCLAEDSGLLEVDQDDLQTVIPKPGGTVMFVRGKYCAKRGILESISEAHFSAVVRIRGSEGTELVAGVEYESISKI